MTQDTNQDRPNIPIDPPPVRLLSDRKGELIRAVGAGRDDHWSGFIAKPCTFLIDNNGIVRWVYWSESPTDRPNPNLLAEVVAALAMEKELPNNYPPKLSN